MSNWIVFGASGATGKQVVTRAVAAGHRVTAFVRDPAKLAGQPGVTAVRGDVTDPAAVAAAIVGHDAVICVLGAPATDRGRVREVGTRHILAGMRAAGVRRVVVQSTYGLGETRAQLPWFVRNVVVPLWLARAFADHEAQEGLVMASDLDWTILRPPFLVDGPATGAVKSDDLTGASWKISRDEVARLLVARAGDGGWPRARVPVTW